MSAGAWLVLTADDRGRAADKSGQHTVSPAVIPSPTPTVEGTTEADSRERLDRPATPHGTHASYQGGCREACCRAARMAYLRELYAQRHNRLPEPFAEFYAALLDDGRRDRNEQQRLVEVTPEPRCCRETPIPRRQSPTAPATNP